MRSDPDAATTAELAFNAYRYVMAQRGGDYYADRMPVWTDLVPVIQQVWAEASRPLITQIAEARAGERERIKTVGAVSACCGAEYHREPGVYGRWQCHACGNQCDLIGVIA